MSNIKRAISKSGSGTRAYIIKKYATPMFLITSIWFILTLLKFLGSNYKGMSEIASSPFNVAMLMLFALSGFASFLHDFSEMVQDYIRSGKMRFVIMFVAYFIVGLTAIALIMQITYFITFIRFVIGGS